MKKKAKAQATMEYIILLAALIAFFAVFLKRNGFFDKQLNATYTASANTMTALNDRLLAAYSTEEGCVPDSDPCVGIVCGQAQDSCGNTVNCGACNPPPN